MTSHERAYRRLLSLFPVAFRERYEEQMVTLFNDQVRLARASGSGTWMVTLWFRSLGDLVSSAAGEHLRKEELVPRPLDPGAVAMVGEPAHGGLIRLEYALALLPLWSWIILQIATPDYMNALFANPPSLVGLPAGMVSTLVAGSLMAFGILAMRSSGSASTKAAAFLLLTIPSLILVLLAPAIISMIMNLPV